MYKKSKFNKFYYEENEIFLFNSFTRSCIQIEKDKVEIIEKLLDNNKEYIDQYADYYNTLASNGYLVNENIDEVSVLEYFYYSNYFKTDQMNIVLVPTLKCNFKCPYCFEEGFKEESIENKNYFICLRKFADKNFLNKRKIHVTLFGGEPLLKQEEIFDYLEYLSNQSKHYQYTLSTNIVTNGYLLDSAIFDKLMKYNCISIQMTIDGNKDNHDKLRVLHDNSQTYDIIMVMNPD